MDLSEDELETARKIVGSAEPGTYELRELYGARWTSVASPTTFGMRFKRAVQQGRLPGVTLGEKTGSNHWLYLVTKA